jgi:hypothetical protein
MTSLLVIALLFFQASVTDPTIHHTGETVRVNFQFTDWKPTPGDKVRTFSASLESTKCTTAGKFTIQSGEIEINPQESTQWYVSFHPVKESPSCIYQLTSVTLNGAVHKVKTVWSGKVVQKDEDSKTLDKKQ